LVTGGAKSAAGRPAISFHAHLVRAGNEAGARVDFEQMLGLLVQRVEGDDAHLVWAHPGDWGIDVLVGDLNGSVRIWQAKYFPTGIGKGQVRQIKESFQSAMQRAKTEGHRIERWTLCVPADMDTSALSWWPRWRADQESQSDDLRIELWDANRLRELLMRPEAEDVRRAYYDPYRAEPDPDAPLPTTPGPATAGPAIQTTEQDAPWRGGEELRFGHDCYLLRGKPVELIATDGSVLTRETDADQIEPRPGRVWLRQVRVLAPSRSSGGARDALRAQARLLSAVADVADAPRLLDVHEEPASTTLVVARLPGTTWRETYPSGSAAADRFIAADVLDAMAPLCATLAELHRRGLSHRALTPASLIVLDRGRRAVLRDLGLAGVPPAADEGPPDMRAPEQRHPLGMGGPPGPRTDLYQLAAIVYETLTGHRPSPSPAAAPVRAVAGFIPRDLDEALLSALDGDLRRRPRDIAALARALARGRRDIARGGPR
jgi:hypothetical protein